MRISRLFLILVLFLAVPAFAAPAKDLMTRAFEAYQKKDFQKAVTLLEQHLQAKPDDPQGHYAIGLALYELGRSADSAGHLEQSLKLQPDFVQAQTTYGAVIQHLCNELVNEGRLDDALATADRAVALLPEEAGVHFARGAVLFERWRQSENPDDHLQALLSWSRCRELKPVSATGEILAGIAAFESYDYARAREHFAVARVMRPNNRYAAMWLGLAEAAVGDHEKALVQFNDAMEMFGKNPSVHRYIGDVYAMQGRLAEAEQEYRAALALKPNDARVHATLGELALRTGRLDVGAQEYEQAVRLKPESFAYRFRLATVLRDAGRSDEAMAELQRARKVPSASELDLAEADLERALLLLEKGDRDGAKAAFPDNEAALVDRSRNPRIFLYRAWVAAPSARENRTAQEEREVAIRQALAYSGPDALALHSGAFLAWADLEAARNQRLRALEMVHQAWRRTPAGSARLAGLKELFERIRVEDIALTDKQLGSLGPLWVIDPPTASRKAGYLNRRLEALRTMQLGEPGDLVSQAPGTPQVVRTLVPAELDGDLSRNVQTAVSADAWMRQKPSWEQK